MTEPPKFTDTNEALRYLKGLFPSEAFRYRTPPIIWKNQLYALIENRTLVDRNLVSIIYW